MPETVAAARTPRPLVLALAGTLGLIFAGTAALWAHYGTAVFYEMILAGLAYCF
jgi:hypothetical protein